MNKNIPIIVLFGPCGAGKSYIANSLTCNKDFVYIPKYADIKGRNNNNLIKNASEKLYEFDYVDSFNISEEELVFKNYEKKDAIKISDIDRALVQGKVPVIILRTREQIGTIQKLYKNRNLIKLYIRANKSKLEDMLSLDKTRTEQSKKSIIENLDNDFLYHDETAKLDPTTKIIENDYSGVQNILTTIKNLIRA